MDVTLQKAHELGYVEHKLQMKEARINLPMVTKWKAPFKFQENLTFLADN